MKGTNSKTMYDFISEVTKESQTCPGVFFTYRITTEGVRGRLMLELADALAALRDVQVQMEIIELPRTADGSVDLEAPTTPDLMRQVYNLTDKLNIVRRTRINPVYVKSSFVSVSGIRIDGKEVIDCETLRERGPKRLYTEIVNAIVAEVELSEAERQNLESPTTSGGLVGEQTSDTIAPTANQTNSTKTESVTSTSPVGQ